MSGSDPLRVAWAAFDHVSNGVTVADALAPGQPLVLVNRSFERLTGYRADEVLGKNCRFLQGKGSSSEVLAEIRAAVGTGRACHVHLRNYRKDGTAFLNELKLLPIHQEGVLTHFVGIQNDVTAHFVARALYERVGAFSPSGAETLAAFDEWLAAGPPVGFVAGPRFGVLVVDTRGRIRFASRLAAAALKASAQALADQPLLRWVQATGLVSLLRAGAPPEQECFPGHLLDETGREESAVLLSVYRVQAPGDTAASFVVLLQVLREPVPIQAGIGDVFS